MLNLASFFHLNLMYSSIGVEDRGEVIQRCYHPLLDLASPEFPVSLEATALTLEMIQERDASWLEKLKEKRDQGSVEFVGSGYSQIIAPLVPGKVNQANLKLGQEVYQAILGFSPDIWLVNEMAYSGGLPELFDGVGARALVMEWNNTWKGHPEWDPELRYHYQLAQGCDGTTIPVLWIDTIDFQKFQRLAHGQLDQEQWIQHWENRAQRSTGKNRFATLYGSDAEVFDFRPGRYTQEGKVSPEGEWKTIAAGMKRLVENSEIKLNTLSAALAEEPSSLCGNPLRLECPGQPVVVKKQEKYNLNRWAVTGRGDLEANTACHDQAARLNPYQPTDSSIKEWRHLLWCWSSDFRTHITKPRWESFRKDSHWPPKLVSPINPHSRLAQPIAPDQKVLELDNGKVQVKLDLNRGLAVQSLAFTETGMAPPVGTLAHGYFDDIAFGADFFTGHAVVQFPGQPKLTDLLACATETSLIHGPDGALVAWAEIKDRDLKISKKVEVLADSPEVVFSGRLELPSRHPGEIHPFHVTVVPGFFEAASLEYRTHNGGLTEEVFSLDDSSVHHGAPYSSLVSAKGGLGATEGVVKISDGKRTLVVTHDPTVSALVPTVRFEKVRGGEYFLRLRYSAQEVDETFVGNQESWQLNWRIKVEVHLNSNH